MRFLSGSGLAVLAEHLGSPAEWTLGGVADHLPALLLPARALGSVIIVDFLDVFAQFRGKRFLLLWRGGRDGFGARDFHSRCDGHAKTLTLILDTNGNIFGGFTLVGWESRKWNWEYGNENNCLKADASLKSFLFTLQNPHNVPARRFALKAEKEDEAILCNLRCGQNFWGIGVCDNCNAKADSSTSDFGHGYTSHTGL
jgi:hypothetical protein